MLNFIKKFLKISNNDSSVEHKYLDANRLYQKLKDLSASNKTQAIRDLLYLNANESFINECLEKSIFDGDSTLFDEVFSYKGQRTIGSIPSTNILALAMHSFGNDKPYIFEKLIDSYYRQHSNSSSYDSSMDIKYVREKVVDSHKANYLTILEKNKLINFNLVIADIIDNNIQGKITEQGLNNINYILYCFPKKIDKEKLFVYACSGGQSKKPDKRIIELFILHDVDIHCHQGEGLLNVGKAKNLELVKYLLDISYLKSDKIDNPYPIVETKYGGYLSSVASRCAQVRNNDKVIKCFLEHGAYIDVVRYAIDRNMYPWIEKYSESSKLFNELGSELKSSQEVNIPKTKKLKV